jgi:hypothetical protein
VIHIKLISKYCQNLKNSLQVYYQAHSFNIFPVYWYSWAVQAIQLTEHVFLDSILWGQFCGCKWFSPAGFCYFATDTTFLKLIKDLSLSLDLPTLGFSLALPKFLSISWMSDCCSLLFSGCNSA